MTLSAANESLWCEIDSTVLMQGGKSPLIVWKDVDLDKAVSYCKKLRVIGRGMLELQLCMLLSCFQANRCCEPARRTY